MQNKFAGMKPSCSVLSPMTQMIKLFAAASTQPSQHLLPTRIVEKTVRTQDKQSSRNTSESTSNFIWPIVPRIDGWCSDRGRENVTLVTPHSQLASQGVSQATNTHTGNVSAQINPGSKMNSSWIVQTGDGLGGGLVTANADALRKCSLLQKPTSQD